MYTPNETILITGVDSFYTVALVYVLSSYILGKTVDLICIKLFGEDFEKKGNFKLLMECAVQLGLTAAICYPARKVVDNLPFPISNDDYKKIKLKDFEEGGVIWSAIVVFFEPVLIKKIKYIQKNITSINVKNIL
jgi:hypothetical protein